MGNGGGILGTVPLSRVGTGGALDHGLGPTAACRAELGKLERGAGAVASAARAAGLEQRVLHIKPEPQGRGWRSREALAGEARLGAWPGRKADMV